MPMHLLYEPEVKGGSNADFLILHFYSLKKNFVVLTQTALPPTTPGDVFAGPPKWQPKKG